MLWQNSRNAQISDVSDAKTAKISFEFLKIRSNLIKKINATNF